MFGTVSYHTLHNLIQNPLEIICCNSAGNTTFPYFENEVLLRKCEVNWTEHRGQERAFSKHSSSYIQDSVIILHHFILEFHITPNCRYKHLPPSQEIYFNSAALNSLNNTVFKPSLIPSWTIFI